MKRMKAKIRAEIIIEIWHEKAMFYECGADVSVCIIWTFPVKPVNELIRLCTIVL